MTELSELSEQIKALSNRVEELADGDDLDLDLDKDEPTKKYSQMLEINPDVVDSFGDSVELITKSRLANNAESYRIALNFVEREYHNMIGNRYGKHSKLIPVYDETGKKNKIDLVWFSGSPIKVVSIPMMEKPKDELTNEIKKFANEHNYSIDFININSKEFFRVSRPFYKIRLLVYDILVKKMLLARIPTSDGKARDEEIKHIGAGRLSEQGIQDMLNISPMKPIKYGGGQRKMIAKNVGEMVFE